MISTGIDQRGSMAMIRTLTLACLAGAILQPVQASMIERRLSPGVSTLGAGAVRVCVDTASRPDRDDQSQKQMNVLKDLKAKSDPKGQ